MSTFEELFNSIDVFMFKWVFETRTFDDGITCSLHLLTGILNLCAESGFATLKDFATRVQAVVNDGLLTIGFTETSCLEEGASIDLITEVEDNVASVQIVFTGTYIDKFYDILNRSHRVDMLADMIMLLTRAVDVIRENDEISFLADHMGQAAMFMGGTGDFYEYAKERLPDIRYERICKTIGDFLFKAYDETITFLGEDEATELGYSGGRYIPNDPILRNLLEGHPSYH